VAVYSVIILADTMEQVSALRGMNLDLHERAARRRPDSGDYAVPAVLTDEQVAQLRADGYRVDIQADAEQLAVERAAEVTPEVNRLAARPAARTRARYREASSTLQRQMDLSDLDETATSQGARGERAVLGGYLTAAEVESALQTLAAVHPKAASVSPLPEQSWGGLTSHVLRIRAGEQQARTGVLITGSMHAREWGGSDVCVAFATNLLRS